ncbi:MAG: hypothetical protein LBS31_11680 [Candidatus Adiutrix sp.]|jgi:hypothetical protein|nr:hypothetical protein [Candidatus Adiutrix sp.]
MDHHRQDHAAAGPRAWKKPLAVLFLLLAGLGGLLYVASPYAAKPYGLVVTPSAIAAIDEAFDGGYAWKLLLPYAYNKGDGGYARYAWAPSSLIPLYLLEKTLPPKAVYMGLALFMAGFVFLLTFKAGGGLSLAALVSIFLTLGTHLHYNFTMGNTNLFYLVYCYAALHLYALLPWLRGRQPSRGDRLLLALALILLFFSGDHWLAYICGLLGALMAVAGLSLKHGQEKMLRGLYGAGGSALGALALYVAVRSLYAGEHLAPGTEEELIFAHQSMLLMVDDFFNNFMTFLYMVLSVFLPPLPFLDGSQSALFLSEAQVLAGQNGYHPSHTQLVWYSHVFMWRYAAGLLAACFFWRLWRWFEEARRHFSRDALVKLSLGLAVCGSFSFYLLIKMRPYNSMPALGYKTALGVFFFSLLCAYVIVRRGERTSRRRFRLLYGGCIGLVVISFLTRPFMLTRWLAVDGLVGMWRSPLTDFLRGLW